MNTASLDLCKELHELSSWEDLKFWWCLPDDYSPSYVGRKDGEPWPQHPAYNLGYLLRKLPKRFEVYPMSGRKPIALRYLGTDGWQIGWSRMYQLAKEPEDAACKLCIELFKQGILK